VLLEVKAPDEAGRRLSHPIEHQAHLRAEEVHAAVSHAGSEEAGHLDVGGIGVAEGELYSVLPDALSPVELAAEPVEGLFEPIRDGHPCASDPAF
jgi:hypothetical protein